MNKFIGLCLLPLLSSGAVQAVSANAQSNTQFNLAELVSESSSRIYPFIPGYHPTYWNTGGNHQRYNNCYNYAANRISPTNAKSQPGYAKGHRGFNSDNGASCAGVIAGAKADGFREVPSSLWNYKKSNFSNSLTLSALVLAPHYDYHWYRRDSNRRWSHKPGSTNATNLDNSNRTIYDPQRADRGVYTQFCGYFENYSSVPADFVGPYIEQNKGNIYVTGTFQSANSNIETEIAEQDSTTSTVTLLKYSGRENPSVPLEKLSDYLQYRISEVAKLQDTSILRKELAQPGEDFVPSILGYKGLLINDTKGVYFNPGDQVLISEGTIKVLSSNKNELATSTLSSSIIKSSLLDLSLEKDLVNFIETAK
ncbi:hypothetical protein L1077_20410 [Pseudoalteromonas luteoviolacea]|uniref:hypothetical protein n=1 Tax=Pseudoalteromonas luteoviolacea TaxID=43657 RepID=UPI001F3B437A|nr:hypothetical protein [Pseudoalteromonas luteoviolacea]MCF6441803.1 hypothetical protein [Pseudoalteromonas luteoviolacea]